jgi:transcriptional regulator with XRE-family HTH domain
MSWGVLLIRDASQSHYHQTTAGIDEGECGYRGYWQYLPGLAATTYRGRVDISTDIRDFLISRRARITPEQAGLPDYGYGGKRRVQGLRREEVAMLSGISVEYYTRLERGRASGVSHEVLDAIARTLQLDEAERAHLFDLVHAITTAIGPARRLSQERVRPVIQRVLDSMLTIPAYVRNGRLDILAANQLGKAVYSPVFSTQSETPNMARFIFLSPQARDFFGSWDGIANDAVAILRAEAGRNPYDRRLSDLIGELSTRSDEFRVGWAAHNVKFHRTGTKQLHHPIVGDLTLSYEALELAADRGQRILVYTADPDSPSDDALKLLATWSATTPTGERRADAAR